jgi:hypothetical protein
VAPRTAPQPPGREPPTWLVGLIALLLAATAILWTLLTGRTLTEWMRDVSGALVGR